MMDHGATVKLTNKGGNMVGYDNESCPIQWFHQECVQMSSVPDDKRLCPLCNIYNQ